MRKIKLRNLDRIGVSVVIVTYNGRERICPTLRHLVHQKGIEDNWEVLLIDNNSIDNTAEEAFNFWENAGPPCALRIIKEPKAGTMYARQRGIEEANYKYILFCDDDNWLNCNYVKTAFDIIHDLPEVAAAGGMGIMAFEPGFVPPGWLEPYKRNFATGAQGGMDGDTTNYKGCLYSAGAIFSRKWLDDLYQAGFSSSLKGRAGKSMLAGEDTELTYALKLIGGRLYYSSEMKFRHFMPAGRITWEYLKKMWRSFGYSDFIISPYNETVKTFYYRYYFRAVLSTLREFISLESKIIKGNFKEGELVLLQRERKLGELQAMILGYSQYRYNKKMVKKLSRIEKPFECFKQ